MEPAVYVSVIMAPRLGASNQGLWRCRMSGPSGDTGDFWLEEPQSFVDAKPLIMVCRISEANVVAGRILAEVVHDGLGVFLREDDRSWPKVEGLHRVPQPKP